MVIKLTDRFGLKRIYFVNNIQLFHTLSPTMTKALHCALFRRVSLWDTWSTIWWRTRIYRKNSTRSLERKWLQVNTSNRKSWKMDWSTLKQFCTKHRGTLQENFPTKNRIQNNYRLLAFLKKMLQDISSFCGGLKQLSCFFRLTPTSPMAVLRTLDEDLVVHGYTVPKGVNILNVKWIMIDDIMGKQIQCMKITTVLYYIHY